MAEITPNTTTVQDCDNERALLMKILHRLNLNAGTQVDFPTSNVAVTNTPLPINFDGVQPVTVENQPTVHVASMPSPFTVDGTVNVGNFPASQNVAVTNFPASQNVAVTNFPATQPVSGTVGVSNFPAVQPVSGTVNVGNFPIDVTITNTLVPISVDAGVVITNTGSLAVTSTPIEYQVAQAGVMHEDGADKSASTFRVLGRRAGFNSVTILQDLAEWLGITTDLLPELNGTENLELVSSNAADDNTPGGTGTRSVRIVYLNTSYALTSVDYALNGTTAVPVAEKMLFVYHMEALTGGSSETSAGNIDLRVAGGGVIQERITAGNNKSLTARFMVPDGYRCYIGEWSVTSIGGATMDCRIRAQVRTVGRVLNDRYLFQDTTFCQAGAVVTKALGYVQYPPRCKIKVSVITSAAGAANRIDSTFNVLLVQD